MLEPAEPGRGWTVAGRGAVAIAAMLGAGRLAGAGELAAVGAIVPLTALMLMAGRRARRAVLPGGWSELAGGISRGSPTCPACACPIAASTTGCAP